MVPLIFRKLPNDSREKSLRRQEDETRALGSSKR